MAFTLLIVAMASIAGYLLLDSPFADTNSRALFETWKMQFSKQYSAIQQTNRFSIFKANLRSVIEHNILYQQGVQTYQMQLNMFADLTTQQFAQKYLIKNPQFLTTGIKKTGKCTGTIPDVQVKQEWDWTTKGAVTGVKNQGQCGSCWAFSATGSLEGLNYQLNKKLVSFSQQQLVDCSKEYGNLGCNGGLMNQSFWYVMDHGITTQQRYSYKGIGGRCVYHSDMQAFRNQNCAQVPAKSQKSLLQAINSGPVSVAIQANTIGFQLYRKGVFSSPCGTNLDHGVLAVGYGTDGGKPYYKVKNSWGGSWGMSGYIEMARKGDGVGQCGIQLAATLPI